MKRIHPSFLFYAVVFGVIFGVFLGICLDVNIFAANLEFWVENYWWVVILLIAVGFLILRIQMRWLLMLAFAIGVLFGQIRIIPINLVQKNWRALVDQTVMLRGVVATDPAIKETGIAVMLERVVIDNVRLGGRIYVQISDKDMDLMRGDELSLSAKVGEGFGIYHASIYRPKILNWARAGPGNIFARMKRWLVNNVRNALDPDVANLGLGYLIGEKSGLDDATLEKMRLVGMTHVIVASGTHLGILVGAARRLFGKISKFAELFGASLLIFAFMGLVGFTPSMTRAGLVALLSLIVGYVGRKISPVRLLSFAAMITLLISPLNIVDLGWQLSFASFAGIILVGPALTKFFYGGKKPPWLASMLLTSLSPMLVCAPILISNFGMISLLSFVANLVILPTLPYVMLLVLISGLLAAVPGFGFMVVPISFITNLLLGLHLSVVNFLSEFTIFVIKL